MGRVDILTGTLGKALGGATGGYTSGRKEIIDILRQRSRPYLFSNSLAPSMAAASIKAIELVESSPPLLQTLRENTSYFRTQLADAGFNVPVGQHPIIPIILGDAQRAKQTAAQLLEKGIYTTAFSYPVVPRDTARIRVQISAAHRKQDLDQAIQALGEICG